MDKTYQAAVTKMYLTVCCGFEEQQIPAMKPNNPDNGGTKLAISLEALTPISDLEVEGDRIVVTPLANCNYCFMQHRNL